MIEMKEGLESGDDELVTTGNKNTPVVHAKEGDDSYHSQRNDDANATEDVT